MIADSVASYVALRRTTGFAYTDGELFLRSFARFAAERGNTHVRTATAIDWAAQGRSPRQKERRLRTVITFARHARAEDPKHEVPSVGTFASSPCRRPTPFIFSPDQVRSLLNATEQLGSRKAFRPLLYRTLFGLLAATGMRVSEALALRSGDLSDDRILIRKAKFRKARLLPVHGSTVRALERYLRARRRMAGEHLFDNGRGRPLGYDLAAYTFRRLIRAAGLEVKTPGHPRPRIHSLRHSFAVRALEACPADPRKVDRRALALSTYLGHVHLSCTYWYLQATPHLLKGISQQAEAGFNGSCR